MPILGILFVVEILTPLDQTIDLLIKISVMHLHQVLIVEWVVIELLQLFSHFVIDLDVGAFSVLLLD